VTVASKPTSAPSGRQKRVRIFLVLLIVLLLVLLCGLLYVLRSVSTTPEKTPVLANPPGVELVWQAFGGGPLGAMQRPFDVAYDGDATIYVTVPSEGSILAFDSDGKNGRIFAHDAKAEGDTRSFADMLVVAPAGIDVADNGDVYVADRQKMAVVVFGPDGEKLREIPLMGPKTIEVVGDRMYVLTDTSVLHVMDLDGNALGEWGSHGREVDQLDDPMGTAVDADGIIYVSDLNNYRVLALSPDLEYLWQYGESASTKEALDARIIDGPGGITLGADGNLYVVDSIGSTVRVLDRSGNPVSSPLGGIGHTDDQFFYPTGIDWMEEQLFVMADSQHNRIIGVRLTPEVQSEQD